MSYLGAQFNLDGGRCLVYGLFHDYVAAEVLIYQKLTVGVILGCAELICCSSSMGVGACRWEHTNGSTTRLAL